ncbi:BMC domain-containing protein [Paenibacillus sp. KQZ6P-2]|uniref:BMC domain-containing protein n=1 Tax=Paenibacillus mangrovi TaxID=2931978 RepID=A0A9X1WTW0_9BACL|nr:BMC domain-containing protein [Paenibacillus mangrovi]MCJ8013550.1 BMC domain-containing protein [Paenibacillus mangrovi]
MRHSALGLVEVRGYLGAVAVADAALKAASVTCIGVEIIKGGLVTVKLDGDVGAVQAAVEAGAEMAKQLDVLVTRHVIARMHEETAALVAGPVDIGEGQRQPEKSKAMDKEQEKEAVQATGNGLEKVTAQVSVEDNAKHAVSKAASEASVAEKSMESGANSKAEALKATEAQKSEPLKDKASDAAESKKPAAAADMQTKADPVSTVVTKEAGEVKPVTEQADAVVKISATAEKQSGTPKGQNNGGNPRVQAHTQAAKSSKKKKKASS